jgi:hypothetical protein
MDAIRNIQSVTNGEIHLQLPRRFWGKEVEVIVLAPSADDVRPVEKKSLRGTLRHYAKPERMADEAGAWQAVVSERYGHR